MSPFYLLSTLSSVLRASGEFLNCGSQYTVSGRPAYWRQHTTAGNDPRFFQHSARAHRPTGRV